MMSSSPLCGKARIGHGDELTGKLVLLHSPILIWLDVVTTSILEIEGSREFRGEYDEGQEEQAQSDDEEAAGK